MDIFPTGKSLIFLLYYGYCMYRRGFFFSHMGWLMVRKHPDVRIKGKTIDLSDIEQDAFIMFQKRYYTFIFVYRFHKLYVCPYTLCLHRYYLWIMPMLTFVLPTIALQYFLNETFAAAFFSGSLLKFMWTSHLVWAVNSVAHYFGDRPYDK